MTQHLPEHFDADGRPRRALTEKKARNLARYGPQKGMRAVRCDFCEAWHIKPCYQGSSR